MSEWPETKLGEVLAIKYGKDHKSLNEGKIPCYGTGGIMRHVERSLSSEESILLPRKGSLNNIYYINEPFWTVDTLFWTVVNKKKAVPKYLFYVLSAIDFTGLNVGSAVPSLTVPVLNDIRLNLPPLPEQKAIAHILGSLDDKIALNRQMNQTLEAMAQALFKSWFVDFDPVLDNALAAGNPIPEALHAMAQKRKAVPAEKKLVHTNPELAEKFPNSFAYNETLDKWIPEGWEVKKLAEEIKLIGGGTPKTSIEEYWNGDIPWFSVVDAPNDSDVFVIDTEKKVSKKGVQNSSTKILQEGTTIISARGTVGKCAIVGVPMAMNQSCYGIQGINEKEENYTYLVVKKNVTDLQNKSHGSVFSTITRDTFSAIDVIVPTNREVVRELEKLLTASFIKIKSNLFENKTLTQLRDTLLPQLISGKVRVPEGVI